MYNKLFLLLVLVSLIIACKVNHGSDKYLEINYNFQENPQQKYHSFHNSFVPILENWHAPSKINTKNLIANFKINTNINSKNTYIQIHEQNNAICFYTIIDSLKYYESIQTFKNQPLKIMPNNAPNKTYFKFNNVYFNQIVIFEDNYIFVKDIINNNNKKFLETFFIIQKNQYNKIAPVMVNFLANVAYKNK